MVPPIGTLQRGFLTEGEALAHRDGGAARYPCAAGHGNAGHGRENTLGGCGRRGDLRVHFTHAHSKSGKILDLHAIDVRTGQQLGNNVGGFHDEGARRVAHVAGADGGKGGFEGHGGKL